MTCSELEHYLHPYLDGEFDPCERLDLEAHLASCGVCAQRVHAEKQFKEAFRLRVKELSVAAPPQLRAAVQAGLRAERHREQWAPLLRVSAAAAVVAFTAASAYWLYAPMARQKYADDAAARHAKRLPLDVQASAEEVERYFIDKLGRRVAAPFFPNARLAGGRLQDLRDKPAAYFVYETSDRPGRFGVFAIAADDDEPFDPRPEADVRQSHGYNVVSWGDNGVNYVLVTDTTEDDVRRMVQGQPSPARMSPPPTLQVQPATLRQ